LVLRATFLASGIAMELRMKHNRETNRLGRKNSFVATAIPSHNFLLRQLFHDELDEPIDYFFRRFRIE
jgi:hypothetical protein